MTDRLVLPRLGWRLLFTLLALCGFAFAIGHAQDATNKQELPATWVDKDTGHRVYRLTTETQSSGSYFKNDAYSPDGHWMVYTAPDGIHDGPTHAQDLAG